MKTRSKALYAYLLEAGVLNATPAEIDRAKCEYRRNYKRQWKENKRPRKEIRIEFTLKQFQAVKMKAREFDLPHTAYARQIILASVEVDLGFIPYREKLEKILQLISITAIASAKSSMYHCQIPVLLGEAENMLLQYLDRKECRV